MGAAVGREDKCPVRASQGSAWTDGKGRGERASMQGSQPLRGPGALLSQEVRDFLAEAGS